MVIGRVRESLVDGANTAVAARAVGCKSLAARRLAFVKGMVVTGLEEK